MNRERAKELLPIIQAFAEGKTIQGRRHEGYDWADLVGDLPNDSQWQYRIKPELRRMYTDEELKALVGKPFYRPMDGATSVLADFTPKDATATICIGYHWYSREQFHDQWRHLDGTHLGVVEEE